MGIVRLASDPNSGNTWIRAVLANLFASPPAPVPVNRRPNVVHADHAAAHDETVSGKPFAAPGELSDGLAQPVIADHREVMQRFGYLNDDGSSVF